MRRFHLVLLGTLTLMLMSCGKGGGAPAVAPPSESESAGQPVPNPVPNDPLAGQSDPEAPQILAVEPAGIPRAEQWGALRAIANYSLASYTWDFGGGATPRMASYSLAPVTFGTANTYTGSVIGHTSDGRATAPYEFSYTPQFHRPVITSLEWVEGEFIEGHEVTLRVLATNSPLKYTVGILGSGSVQRLSQPGNADIRFRLKKWGEVTLRIQAVNDWGKSEMHVRDFVILRLPRASMPGDFGLVGTPGGPFTIDPELTGPPDQVQWEMGGGAILEDPTASVASATLGALGDYTGSLQASNALGSMGPQNFSYRVGLPWSERKVRGSAAELHDVLLVDGRLRVLGRWGTSALYGEALNANPQSQADWRWTQPEPEIPSLPLALGWQNGKPLIFGITTGHSTPEKIYREYAALVEFPGPTDWVDRELVRGTAWLPPAFGRDLDRNYMSYAYKSSLDSEVIEVGIRNALDDQWFESQLAPGVPLSYVGTAFRNGHPALAYVTASHEPTIHYAERIDGSWQTAVASELPIGWRIDFPGPLLSIQGSMPILCYGSALTWSTASGFPAEGTWSSVSLPKSVRYSESTQVAQIDGRWIVGPVGVTATPPGFRTGKVAGILVGNVGSTPGTDWSAQSPLRTGSYASCLLPPEFGELGILHPGASGGIGIHILEP